MELFNVKRFNSDERPDDPSKESRILHKLQRNIEKKRQKQQETQELKLAADTDQAKIREEQQALTKNADETLFVNESLPIDTVSPANDESKSIGEEFQVLGVDRFKCKRHVNVMLPNWLAYPTVISKNLTEHLTAINEIDYISTELRSSLIAMNIKHLFPVQEAVIPYIINVHKKPAPFRPRDICVSAPTGSGKTLAYAIPIVQQLSQRVSRKIRALVILPVNELAMQVLKIFQKLCEPFGLKIALLSKFTPFAIEQQQLVEQFDGSYFSKVDILIATTGRLVEHIHSTKGFSLKFLEFLVIDEADRIMEQIQNNWLYHLDVHVKDQSDTFLSGKPSQMSYNDLCSVAINQPQKLLFSATLSQDPEKLQNFSLFMPKLFTSIVLPFDAPDMDTNTNEARRGEFIGKYTTPAELTEKYCLTEGKIKPLTLYTLLKENKWARFLCFTNSGESAHRLSYVLQTLLGTDMKIEELSSSLTPSMRNTVLLKFQTGKVEGIVCSDALARGIDIPDVDVVISYDAPRHVKTYIHRIGRTARAGRLGTAVTLLTTNEINAFQDIIKSGRKENVQELKVTENSEEIMAKNYAIALERMQNALKRETQIKIVKQMNERNKVSSVKHGFIGKLQSQVHRTDSNEINTDFNMPESWKWKNLGGLNERKERKGKRNRIKNDRNTTNGSTM